MTETGATFSDCRAYRYRLWRRWADDPMLAFCMLNPSTADETADDPTVARCRERARGAGYGGVIVVNLFALRSTDPKALYSHAWPTGPDNDRHILNAAKEAGTMICAWGQHGKLYRRGEYVRKMLINAGVKPMALKLSKNGQPAHPLYLSYELQPFVWAT